MINFDQFQNFPTPLTGDDLRDVISRIADESVAGEGSIIRFRMGETTLICIYDEIHDRMRVVCPIAPLARVTEDERDLALEANFHSALDARYAASEGVLYSIFIHRLSSLAARDLVSGIEQTRKLALTFGREYTSGALHFWG